VNTTPSQLQNDYRMIHVKVHVSSGRPNFSKNGQLLGLSKKIIPKPECHVDHPILSSSNSKFVGDIKPVVI